MKTLENTKTRKVKSVEVQYSNMTFIVEAGCHYVEHYAIPGWVKTYYSATIKETGEGTGMMGSKEDIKNHLELINSRPDLFLK